MLALITNSFLSEACTTAPSAVIVTSTSGSFGPEFGSTGKSFGSLYTVNVNPETNGVRMSPSNPVTPAMPITAKTASASSARNGPIKGTHTTAAVTAAPIAASSAAVPAPNCSRGTLSMTTFTNQSGPVSTATTEKSAVSWIVSLKGT